MGAVVALAEGRARGDDAVSLPPRVASGAEGRAVTDCGDEEEEEDEGEAGADARERGVREGRRTAEPSGSLAAAVTDGAPGENEARCLCCCCCCCCCAGGVIGTGMGSEVGGGAKTRRTSNSAEPPACVCGGRT